MKKILLILLTASAILAATLLGRSVLTGRVTEKEKDCPGESENVIREDQNKSNENSDLDQKATRSQLKIIAAGDMMFHMPQIYGAIEDDKGYDFASTFEYIVDIFQGADIAIANLETVVAGDQFGFSGFPRFNSPEAVLDAISDAGFTILVTSNNHSLDMGKTGIENTIDNIKLREMDYLGTSKDIRRPFVIKDVKGIRVAILSYTYGLNGLDSLLTEEERERMVNITDKEVIKLDLAEKAVVDSDFVIAYMHWGNQYHRKASAEQRELAYFLAENGVDLILGSHPHLVQEAEVIEINGKESWVFYSLGNLVSNQSYQTMGVSGTDFGVLIELLVQKDSGDSKAYVQMASPIPTWVYKSWTGKAYDYSIVPVEKVLGGQIDIELGLKEKDQMVKFLKETMETLGE